MLNAPDGPARTLIDPEQLLHVLGSEAEALAETVVGARQESIVPGCPGLTLGETARHVGSLYRMVWRWLRDGQRPGNWQRDPVAGQDLAGYVRSGTAPLLAELAMHPADRPAPTWWPDEPNFGFWRRRMAHETTVHRYDVQGAAGQVPDQVPDDVALDGIDEVLTLWFEHRLSVLGVCGTRDELVTIRTGGLEWVARAGIGRTRTSRPGAPVPADLESTDDDQHARIPDDHRGYVSGSPMEVYLWLWGRRPDRVVLREGSEDAIAQLWALLRLATR